MTIYKESFFASIDKMLKRCERFSDRKVEELGIEGIEADAEYIEICELITTAYFDGITCEQLIRIYELAELVENRWGW